MNDIHPSAKIAKTARVFNSYIGANCVIGEGTKIANFCNIDAGAIIGNNCNLQIHCYVPSNCVIEDNVFMAGFAKIADEKYPSVGEQIRAKIRIGKGAIMGINSTLIACSMGEGAVLGAGSIAFKDIPANEVWVGTPAKFLTTRAEYERKKHEWESSRRD